MALAFRNPQSFHAVSSLAWVTIEHPCYAVLRFMRKEQGKRSGSREVRASLVAGRARQSYTGVLGKEPNLPLTIWALLLAAKAKLFHLPEPLFAPLGVEGSDTYFAEVEVKCQMECTYSIQGMWWVFSKLHTPSAHKCICIWLERHGRGRAADGRHPKRRFMAFLSCCTATMWAVGVMKLGGSQRGLWSQTVDSSTSSTLTQPCELVGVSEPSWAAVSSPVK